LREELSAENRERFVKLRETMEEAAPEAFTSLRLSAKKSWKAAESLLHMAGFTPEQKIKQTVENIENEETVKQSANQIAEYVRQNLASGNKKNP
jgi:hypothetical protein